MFTFIWYRFWLLNANFFLTQLKDSNVTHIHIHE